MDPNAAVDSAFTKALPKIELHAHLTGSISVDTLHQIWLKKQTGHDPDKKPIALPDPRLAIRTGGAYRDIDIATFFPLFDRYIYALCDDLASVAYATRAVLHDFREDGVRYLELRTTPREVPREVAGTGLSREEYVSTVLDVMAEFHDEQQREVEEEEERMATFLILSIDRRSTLAQALDVVALAVKYKHRNVVGVDLCGNPVKGDVSTFAPAFAAAREAGLKITLHFAEVPESSSARELWTLLSYQPQRIGHVIHVPEDVRAEIERRAIGLELCLSCNVLAKMTAGEFAGHHFGSYYHQTDGRHIVLCTDDVGVFGSPLSNEYLLAATHFGLGRKELVDLSRRAIPVIFGSDAEKIRLARLLDSFESAAR